MRPDLRHTFQERFHGHEADVDPGVWDAIRTQISAPAADPVEELFRDRFQGHEVPVDPGVWNAISTQIGQVAAVGTASSGGTFLNWAAAGLATLVLSTGIYLATRDAEADPEFAQRAEVTVDQEKPLVGARPAGHEVATQRSASLEVDKVAEVQDIPEPTVTISTNADVPVSQNATPRSASGKDPRATGQNSITSEVNKEQEQGDNEALFFNPLPRSGNVVVKDVMLGLKQQLHEEALAEEKVDPIGPPAVERTEDPEPAPLPERTQAPMPLPDVADIFMPNTFTPNGDGINDTYRIDRQGFQSMMIRIYSLQNNSLVFSTDTNEEWDGGTFQKGYYLVAIEAITDDGRLVTKGKAVWLNNEY